MNMNKIYFVAHPMNEPSCHNGNKGDRFPLRWAITEKHHRKFMMRKGEWKNGDKIEYMDLYFWGEYEAHSDYVIENNEDRPKAIHDVLYPVRGDAPLLTKALNTDPYVFGNHFKNICCGIRERQYESGDFILFGYWKQNNFHFDTVFVVDRKRYIKYFQTDSQYYKIAIEPYNADRKIKSLPKVEYYYQGKNYYEEKKYYSFVPCSLEYTSLELPYINPISFGKHREANSENWQMILKAVKDAGWKIGIQIDKI